MKKLVLIAALVAAVIALPAEAGRYGGGSYGGGFRSSSSFSSSRSFSSRSYSSPSRSFSAPTRYGSTTRSYAGPKSSFYSKPSSVKPTIESETPRSILRGTPPRRTTYYTTPTSRRHGYYYAQPPRSYGGSNMGWYAFAAYVMFFDHPNNNAPAVAPTAAQQKGLCDLSYDDLSKIIGDDNTYTTQELAVVKQWRTTCNHPRS